MKKFLIPVLVLALIMGAASFVMADEDSPAKYGYKAKFNRGIERPQLQISDEQKAQIAAMRTQMLEIKKEIVKQNIDQGIISEEQGTKFIEMLDKQIAGINSGDIKGQIGYKFNRGFRQKQTKPQAQ